MPPRDAEKRNAAPERAPRLAAETANQAAPELANDAPNVVSISEKTPIDPVPMASASSGQVESLSPAPGLRPPKDFGPQA
ncbi:MAG: hypothetical protein ACT4N4_08265, partial [Rhodospirillales bacterium]